MYVGVQRVPHLLVSMLDVLPISPTIVARRVVPRDSKPSITAGEGAQ